MNLRDAIDAADDAMYADFIAMKSEVRRRAQALAMAALVAQAIFGWLP